MSAYTFDHLRESNFKEEKAKFQAIKIPEIANLLNQTVSRLIDFVASGQPDHARDCGVIIYLCARELERESLVDETFQMLHTLKVAGFPQYGEGEFLEAEYDEANWPPDQPPPVGPYFPPLAEMIYRLGDHFGVLERFQDNRHRRHCPGFGAYIPNDIGTNGLGATPFLALARLWLATCANYDGPLSLPPGDNPPPLTQLEEDMQRRKQRNTDEDGTTNPLALPVSTKISAMQPPTEAATMPECTQAPACIKGGFCATQGDVCLGGEADAPPQN